MIKYPRLGLLWGVSGILCGMFFSAGNSSHVIYSVDSDGTISQTEIPDTNHLTFQSNSSQVISNDCININTADKDHLILLPGIGPSLAERILEYRRETGVLTGFEDLDKVKGFGPAKIEKVKSKICF